MFMRLLGGGPVVEEWETQIQKMIYDFTKEKIVYEELKKVFLSIRNIFGWLLFFKIYIKIFFWNHKPKEAEPTR